MLFDHGVDEVVQQGQDDVQVLDLLAMAALEVEVREGPTVIARLGTRAAGEAIGLTDLLKDLEIAVDGAQTDTRQTFANALVELAGRGMSAAGLELLEHDLALAGIASLTDRHGSSP